MTVFTRTLRLLFIAKPEARKGLDTVLAAMQQLDARTCTLTVAGSSWWEMQELHAALGYLARHRITFLGRVDNACLRPVIHSHDVVLVPSHYEHFGNVSIEAQAAGRPVIAAATGGLAETVAHQHSGCLFQPRDPKALADAIAELADDPERALEMGAQAAERARQLYAWPLVVERFDDLLSSIASGKAASRLSST